MKKPTLLLSVVFCCVSVFAQDKEFSPQIKRVAVFKNGYAFTYREGETTANANWVYTTHTPVGVLGTVWGYSTTPNVRVEQLLASEFTSSSNSERVQDIAEILIANDGKRIRVVDGNFGDKIYEGTYEIVSRYRGFQEVPKPEGGYPRSAFELSLITLSIKTDSGILLLPASAVRKIEILDPQPNLLKPKRDKVVRLGIKTSGAKDGQPVSVGIAALERGIRWIPAYRVEVKGDPIKEAKLELEANIVNDLADLENTDINFVVGVPHFMFQDMASPLSINTAFAGVSSNFRRDESNRRLSNAISSQVVSMDGASDDDASPTIAGEERSNAFSAEQLFLYQTSKLALKKGERATTRLFSLTVPCTEVFEWTINDVSDIQQRYLNPGYGGQNQQLNSLQDLATKIWYALRLKNTTGMPWTTAPAISFRDWKPLGQDLLKFTTIGGEEVLRVTPATEVSGFHSLEETERTQEKLRWNGSNYDFDLVTVEGTIKLRNVQKRPIELVLTRNLVGQVLSASDEASITKSGLNLQSVNSNSIVKWNVQIPPGEKELKYSYKVYIRK